MIHVILGLKQLKKHLVTYLLVMIVVWGVTSFAIPQYYAYSDRYTTSNRIKDLDGENIYYVQSSNFGAKRYQELNQLMSEWINQGKAVVVLHDGLEENPYLVVGDYSRLLTFTLPEQSERIYCFSGKHSKYQLGDVVTYGDRNTHTVEVSGYFQDGDWIFEGSGIFSSDLDEHTVIFMDMEEYEIAFFYYDLTGRIFLVDCSDEDIVQMVRLAEKGNVVINISDLESLAQKMYPDRNRRYSYYLTVVFLGAAVLYVITMFYLLKVMSDENRMRNGIHITYGARPIHIFIQLFVSSFTVTVLPLLPDYLFWAKAPFELINQTYVLIILLSVGFCLITALLHTWKLSQQDLCDYMRGE